MAKNLDILKEKFMNRNYPETLINEQFEKAKKKDRKQLIYQNRKQKNTPKDEKIRLIFTYNEGNPPLHKWIRECKNVLIMN